MAVAPCPFPYPSTATYPPPFSSGCYPSPFSSYPAPAPYPHNLWSTPSTPSESIFPTPTSFPACCYSTAPAASTFSYSQVHSPPPGSYGPNPSTPPSSTPSSSLPPPSSGPPSPRTSYPGYAAPGTPATTPPSSTHPGTPSSGGPATPSSPAHCDADLSYSKADEVCTFQASDGDYSSTPTTTARANSSDYHTPACGFPSVHPSSTSDSMRFTPPPPAGRPSTSVLCRPDRIPGAPLFAESSSPTFPTKMQPDPAPLFDLHAPMASFRTERPTTLPTIPASSRAIAGEPAGCVVMPPSANEVRRSADNPRGLCTAEDSDGKSGSAFHTSVSRRQPDRPPTAITNLASLLELDDPDDASSSSGDRETNAFRRQATAAAFPGSMATASSTSALFSSASSVFPVSASAVPAVAAYVAPQVFDEMPSPNSWLETHGKAPNYCSGHDNPCVSNLSEQNLEGRQQQYGFHNLIRHSVFLADGYEHSYFALPEDYPLERAVPEPVFDVYDEETEGELNEHVDVFASSPGKKPYEEDQQDSEQPLMCFSKAQKTEQTFACLNYISDLFDCTLEQHQQNDETTSVNVQQLRAPPLDVLVLHERRKIWDPGAPVILYSYTTTHPRDSTRIMLVLFASCREITEDCFADKELMANTSSKLAALTWHSSQPGTPFILLSSTTYAWYLGVLCIIKMMLDKYAVSHQVQFIQLIVEHPFLSLTACIQYIALNDMSSTLHATCFILQKSARLTQDNYLCSLYWNSVVKTSYVWDPGVKISFYSWLNIVIVWSENDKPLSCTHVPDLAAWQNQSVASGASYIWDPGTILWYTFVSVSNTLNAYYLAVRHSNGRSIYYPENIMCYLTVSTVLEEKEMPSGQSIRFWSFRLAPMQCNDYQTCNSLSCQQHSHQDIAFCKIALWLIHFQPP